MYLLHHPAFASVLSKLLSHSSNMVSLLQALERRWCLKVIIEHYLHLQSQSVFSDAEKHAWTIKGKNRVQTLLERNCSTSLLPLSVIFFFLTKESEYKILHNTNAFSNIMLGFYRAFELHQWMVFGAIVVTVVRVKNVRKKNRHWKVCKLIQYQHFNSTFNQRHFPFSFW